MIDAHLVTSRPRTAAVEAQRSFDAELALSNAARFAVALAEKGAAAAVRRPAARALASLLDGDPGAVSRTVAALRAAPCDDDRMTVLVSRLAHSVEHYAAARERLGRPVSEEEVTAAGSDFTPAAPLVNGWLPGSTPVSTEASTTSGRGPLDRATMPPYLRTTIQIAVAGTLAVLAGNAISGQRVYWAVLTVFVSFLMVNNTGEQVRRALFRAGGTAIGIVLGDLFVHLTGGRVWASVLVVLVAMFLGVYLLRINYMFLTIAITVMIAQLYVQLDEFSWHVLLLRLAETAVGVAAVVLTVLVIVPLRPQRVLATGVLQWLRALRTLVEAVLGRFDGTREPLPPLVRGVDAAYAALEATATPLRQVTFGRTSTQVTEVLAATSAARVYARSLTALVEDADAAGAGCPEARSLPLQAAAEQLFASLGAMEHRLVTGEHDDYVRSASLIAPALDELRRRPRPGLEDALTDLVLLDGALARLAAALQMGVVDHDTGRPTRAQVGSDGRAQTQPSS
jgi:hypothetical protein